MSIRRRAANSNRAYVSYASSYILFWTTIHTLYSLCVRGWCSSITCSCPKRKLKYSFSVVSVKNTTGIYTHYVVDRLLIIQRPGPLYYRLRRLCAGVLFGLHPCPPIVFFSYFNNKRPTGPTDQGNNSMGKTAKNR